ncbi:MAG TPA: DUF1330 domain-containing protein [Alphaproteobacteria bacterium]|nr:DUF1330 domain-containing protein [Alphaproteobacteria bacterium]
MTAYLIVHRRDITDPEALKSYADGVDGTISQYGGRVLARNDGFEVLEGEWDPGERRNDDAPERVTVLEFPDMDRLKAWYDSRAYSPLKAIRQRASVCDVVAVTGS